MRRREGISSMTVCSQLTCQVRIAEATCADQCSISGKEHLRQSTYKGTGFAYGQAEQLWASGGRAGGSVKNGIGMEEDAHLLERNAKRSDGPPPIIPFKVILPIASQGSPTS